jgi:predicted MFS family arabinose efflux permease
MKKSVIISDQPKFLDKSTYKAALRLHPIVVVFFMAIFGIFGYFALPILGELLNKDPVENILLIILVSIILLMPFIFSLFFYKFVNIDSTVFVFTLIAFSSIMQTIVRLFYFKKKHYQQKC